MDICDLHCDLLSYLAHSPQRSPLNAEVRCSLPQMKKGGVRFQTLAVYTETEERSTELAGKQFEIFCSLPTQYPDQCVRLNDHKILECTDKITVAASIENASGLCDEKEPLNNCFKRLDHYRNIAGPIIYISLTWNQENRFAGGNLSDVGLKKDGETFLDYLDGTGISIDLSHTSDRSAYGIINYIEKKGLKIMPIASHSNFRSVYNHPRNLSDEIARAILKHQGIIGLNFFKAFVGKNFPLDFVKQTEYAQALGALDSLCFGADFFYDKDFPPTLYPYPYFFEKLGNASCYPQLIECLTKSFSEIEMNKVSNQNLIDFFDRTKLVGV